jgi:hypothetical protein
LEIELKHKEQQQKQQLSPSSLLIPQLKFKTAFEELCNKHALLTCGIEKIDSLLQLTSGDRLAIIGNRKYTQILIARLCINALLLLPSSKKEQQYNSSRVFYTSNVIFVDAGNSCDFYQYVNFARQYYRRDVIDRVLNNTIITRLFTVYQLADIVINQLPKVIEQLDAKLIVISDLLSMFLHDPQIEIKKAKYLINEIINSITKTRTYKDVLVIVSSLPYGNDSLNQYDDKSAILYNKIILPRFDKCIEILNNSDNNDNENGDNMIDIHIRNSKSNIRRIKNTSNDFNSDKLLFSIKEGLC